MYQRIVKVLVDKGYRGDLGELLHRFCREVRTTSRDRDYPASRGREELSGGTKAIDCRTNWIWLENARVLNRNYERLSENHEGIICIVMIRLMLRRLT
jgi:transposase